MGDPKKPGSKGRELLECREFVVRTGESVLNDVFAIHDRAHHARAITMQIRSYVLHERQEPLARRAQIRQRCFMFTHCLTFVLYDNARTHAIRPCAFFPDGAAKKWSFRDSINQLLM